MEYTHKTPNNLSKYIDDFHISVKKEFETALTNIYTSEINKYSDIIEHIVKLPFVQAIVDENIRLKEDISRLRGMSRNSENHLDSKQVVLEISDKPVQQSYQNMDDVVLEHHDSDEDDIEDEDSDDDDNIDKSPCFESNNNTHPTFSKPNIEETRNVEEHVEQPTDEEEEAEDEHCVDDENDEEDAEDEHCVDDENDEEDAEDEHCVDDEDDEEEAEDEQCVDDEDDEEEAEDEEMVDDDEEEQEVTELEIDGKTYYCDGEENGNIYEDDDGDVGNIVGELKDGEAIFH